jgi:hypothetical protein
LSQLAEGTSIPKPKVSKDYYVVRKNQSNKCSIVTGEWANKPVGSLGGAPHATKNYAKAAERRQMIKKIKRNRGQRVSTS